MRLFTKLTSYIIVLRLVLVGTLWFFLPSLMKEWGFVLLMGILVITVLIDFGYVHYLLRPLTLLVNRKLRVMQRPEGIPLLVTSTRDLIQLDEHINDLLRRLNVRFNCEKAFTAYASHELLTPIAILRSSFDNLIVDNQTPKPIAIRLVESQQTLLRLSKIVQLLLRLARIENHQYAKNETVSIRTIVHEVLDDLDDRISLKEIQVNLIFDEDIVIDDANHSLLYTMLLSLLGNAIRHNVVRGGLLISRSHTANVTTLSITDHGPGMAPEQIAALTQYGHPTSSSGDSSGIGLQLILTIATFHHIVLSVVTPPEQGTTIRLSFP